MMVFNARTSGESTGGYLAAKQVFPVEDYQEKISHRLIEAAHTNDLKVALECLADPFVDVNIVGTVCLNSKKTEIVLHDESPSEVRVEFEEFKTDVTALFLAAHAGNVTLVRKLLMMVGNLNFELSTNFAGVNA
ncbi:hypothetical protein HanPSC8_Chr12g0524751 [Helianthus annuus]|nr:hypothetical protein HanPSC8_Chr12g0524751 [Helianthus annuus]